MLDCNCGEAIVGLHAPWCKALDNEPKDMVNQPPHYKSGGIETIDFIQAKLSPEEFRGYLKGNVIKYLSRAELKGGAEDYKKAKWYLDRLAG